MQNIKISVVIPVYNVEKYIKECIESVINQTFKDIEIIVVNDGTKDNSIKIVEKYLYDKRIKIINQENAGLSSARNTGMREARGKYIYFIDSDDFIKNNVLEELYKNSELETMDIVFTNFTYYNDKSHKIEKAKFRFPFKDYINKGYYYLYNGDEINVWNRLYKKEFLLKYKFQKIRVYFKLLELEFWEKSLLNENDYTNEIKKLEIELEKIYKENSFNIVEREVLKKDIRNLIRNKKITLSKKFYWKYGIINFKILRRNLKFF